jgi:hypothetical protein
LCLAKTKTFFHKFKQIKRSSVVVINSKVIGLAPGHPGTYVMILKIFSPKIFAKKMALMTQNEAKF